MWAQFLFVLSDSNVVHSPAERKEGALYLLVDCFAALISLISLSYPSPHYLNLNNRSNTNWFQRLLSLFSIGLAAMMCCLGAFGIMEQTELAEIFVSIYMILFSVLLFLYELMWWYSIDSVNVNLRKNFGFMYGVRGKALYLIFVAFLVIGLKNDVSVKFLRYMTGGCFLGTGVLMLFLHYGKPDLLSNYQAPTAGLGNPV